ncbi:Serine/threonine-protein phosphatase 7 long form [Glycine soja]
MCVYQWHLHRRVHHILKLRLTLSILMYYGCNLSMFQNIWNVEEDRKLHIRRVVPTYQGEEKISEQIFPFLRQSGFAWIIKMGYLKINASLISALIEKWRPETHTFHMRCEECTITLQDVSVLLGISVNGLPLIGPTNLDWADLCEELLGVKPQESEIKGSVVKLSWLAHHFAQINIDDEEQIRRFARAWILRFIRGVLFVDKSSNKVSPRYLQFLREECGTYAWKAAVLDFLYREMCSATDYKTKRYAHLTTNVDMGTMSNLGSKDDSFPSRKYIIGAQMTATWKPTYRQCEIGSLTWYAVVPLICFQVIEWHQPDRVLRQFGMQQPIPESPSQPLNIHGITLKGKHDKNWGQLFAPMIHQWNNRQAEIAETLQYMVFSQGRNTWTIDDLVPYLKKITILSEEQERVIELVSHGWSCIKASISHTRVSHISVKC